MDRIRKKDEQAGWSSILRSHQVLLTWSIILLVSVFVLAVQFLPAKSGASRSPLSATHPLLDSLFHNFTRNFHKNYSTDSKAGQRLSFFQKSLERIERLNSRQRDNLLLHQAGEDGDDKVKGQGTMTWSEGMPKNQGIAIWGLTSLADLSPDEFQAQYLDPTMSDRIKKRRRLHSHHRHHYQDKFHGVEEDVDDDDDSTNQLAARHKRSPLPDKFDWRDKKVVTAIKHQQDCGACWAFSTVSTVESMAALSTGRLVTLSVQQVIDCAKNGNAGCSGGDTCSAVSWMSARKLSPESSYPLTLKDDFCRLQSSPNGVKVATNFTCSTLIGNEQRLIELLASHGPVAVAVDATNWQYYVGGVIQWNCDTAVNHAVQIVGYDKSVTPPHYIVRNSWGPKFGDKGYLYIAVDKNMCGIATEVVALNVE